MLDHHLQRSIVYRLALLDSARFSELQPPDLDNKLFTYHLKKVVATGLVVKNDQGLYKLTAEGRRLGVHVFERQIDQLERANSVLFLVIRRSADGAWLLYKRQTHPLINRIGFMHAIPVISETAAGSAAKAVKENTNLDCQFKVMGSGYFRVFDGDDLESFTHFTMLICEDALGTLSANDDHAKYFWELKPDFASKEMLPNMVALSQAYQSGELFFIEQTLRLG